METTTTTIAEAVEAWPGVHGEHGSRGEYSFKVGAREIGHLHGERVLHIGFPKAIWHELHDAGRIDYHPVFPNKPGFGSRAIASEEDRRDVIALLRLNYDRVIERYGLPTP
jgi:hypothetical protein